MTPANSLSDPATWPEVARVLKLPAANDALPLQTECPLCGGRLSVHQDSIYRGDWHYCFDCKHRGDMLSLAAAVWKTTAHDAIKRLHLEGIKFSKDSLTDTFVDRYIETRVEKGARWVEEWEAAQHRLVNNRGQAARGVLIHLRLQANLERNLLLSGPAQLFGLQTVRQAITFINPDRKSSHPTAGSKDRILSGFGKGELVMIPYFGNPGQICAVQWTCIPGVQEKTAYLSDDVRNISCKQNREFGLAGAAAVLEHPSPFVIGMSNALDMLRLQVRHFGSSLKPLPLVAWYAGKEGRTQYAWEMFQNRKIILWETELTAKAVVQCYLANAHLAILGPVRNEPDDIKRFLFSHSPDDFVELVKNAARPWNQVVSSWLKRASPDQVTKLASELTANGVDPIDLFQNCDIDTSLLTVRDASKLRRVRLGQQQLVQRGNRWYSSNTRRQEFLILNATARVDTVIMRKAASEYRGELITDKKPIPFNVRVPSRDPMAASNAWAVDLAAKHGVRLTPAPRTSILSTAIAFHEPKTVKGRSTIGWDGRAFRFANYSIYRGGIHKQPEYLFPVGSPGLPKAYVSLREHAIERSCLPSLENEINWAITTSLLFNIVGTMPNHKRRGILVAGKSTQPALELALTCLGCPRKPLTLMRGEERVKIDGNSQPRWPLYVTFRNSATQPSVSRWLVANVIPNRVLHLSECIIYPAVCCGNDVAVSCNTLLKNDIVAKFAHLPIVTAYLRYRSKSAIVTPDWEDVHRDVVQWMESLGGDATSIKACRRWVRLPGDEDLLQHFLAAMYRRGLLHFDTKAKSGFAVEFDEQGLLVRKEQINDAFQVLRTPVWDLTDVEDVVRVPRKIL